MLVISKQTIFRSLYSVARTCSFLTGFGGTIPSREKHTHALGSNLLSRATNSRIFIGRSRPGIYVPSPPHVTQSSSLGALVMPPPEQVGQRTRRFRFICPLFKNHDPGEVHRLNYSRLPRLRVPVDRGAQTYFLRAPDTLGTLGLHLRRTPCTVDKSSIDLRRAKTRLFRRSA